MQRLAGEWQPELRRRAVLLGAAAMLAGGTGAAAMALRIVDGLCLVPVLLDGRAASMVLDTGAERSVLTERAAARLGLRRDAWIGTTLRGAGGRLEHSANVIVGRAEAGGVSLGAGLSLPVTGADLGAADGLLGGDLLHHFTLVLDMAHARLVLLAGGVAGGVPLSAWRGRLLLAPVVMDGRALVALVDTGATATQVNARGAYRLALGEGRAGGDAPAAMVGIGGVSAARVHRFSGLQIGRLRLAAPSLLVVPVPQAAYDMTLGLDVLGRQPMVISYADLTLSIGQP